MKLIVGLGNYGQKYEGTRHNFGFIAINSLVGNLPWRYEKKFFGHIATGEFCGEKAVFLKPETYMNISGKSVLAVAQFYKIPAKKIYILSDDLDLEFGVTRFKTKGGAGGHNGLKSIISVLGTQEFPRLKFGIHNELRAKMPTENFVLMSFSAEEQKVLPKIIEKGVSEFLSKID